MEFPNDNGKYELKTALFITEKNFNDSISTSQFFKYHFEFDIKNYELNNMKLTFIMFSKNYIGDSVKETFFQNFTTKEEFLQKILRTLDITKSGSYEYNNYNKCKFVKIA